MKKLLYLTIFLLSLSSVLAVTLDITYNNEDYAKFKIEGCSGTSLLIVTNSLVVNNSFGVLSYLQQGFGNWDAKFYHYYGEGVHLTAKISCFDGTSQETAFCTDTSECTEITNVIYAPTQPAQITPTTPLNISSTNYTYFSSIYDGHYDNYTDLKDDYEDAVDDNDDEDEDKYKDLLKDLRNVVKDFNSDLKDYIDYLEDSDDNVSIELNNSESLQNKTEELIINIKAVYSGYIPNYDNCTPQWTCAPWSVCIANIHQLRTCIDSTECVPDKNETRPCVCTESWVCGDWSTCSSGTQSRTCTDENTCGSITLKPGETQSCSSGGSSGGSSGSSASTPTQNKNAGDLAEIYSEKIGDDSQKLESNVGENGASINSSESSGLWVYLVIGLIMVLIITGGAVYYFIYYKKGSTLNDREMELFNYVQKERGKGISDQNMKRALSRSGWQQDEIDKVLKQ